MIGSKELFLEMQQEVANTIDRVENGQITVLDGLIEMKGFRTSAEFLIDAAKAFESQYVDDITAEADKYPEGYKGYEIQVRNGRKTYDFSNVEEVKIADANLKELKKYYQNAHSMKMAGTLMANEDGEELQLPILKIGKSSIIVKEKR